MDINQLIEIVKNSIISPSNRIFDNNHIAKNFQKLLLSGKIKEAVNFVTNKSGLKNCILNPNNIDIKSGLSVKEVLENKHV